MTVCAVLFANDTVQVAIDMVQFKDIADDADFVAKLYQEESVLVLPAQCFNIRNFFRIVFCPPIAQLEDACERIEQFCNNHYV